MSNPAQVQQPEPQPNKPDPTAVARQALRIEQPRESVWTSGGRPTAAPLQRVFFGNLTGISPVGKVVQEFAGPGHPIIVPPSTVDDPITADFDLRIGGWVASLHAVGHGGSGTSAWGGLVTFDGNGKDRPWTKRDLKTLELVALHDAVLRGDANAPAITLDQMKPWGATLEPNESRRALGVPKAWWDAVMLKEWARLNDLTIPERKTFEDQIRECAQKAKEFQARGIMMKAPKGANRK